MLKAIGLMSGTSLDGVDVALIETDGERVGSFGATDYRRYSDSERGLLRQALADAVSLSERDQRPGALAEAERAITEIHAETVRHFLQTNGLAPSDIDVVGFHGQTVLHRPERKLTVQIGDGKALAKALGIQVVFDLRAADVAAGGQGAPLVPIYHRALALASGRPLPVVFLNIGGVANITYIDGDSLIACDTGPGNALLDDFMLRTTGEAFDRDGRSAIMGKPDHGWIEKALRHPFFSLPPPKSLDRNDFANFSVEGLTQNDATATLTAFTASAIARVTVMLPKKPMSWIVVGGGANNPTLMRVLAHQLAPAIVETGNEIGLSGDAIEAQAFAYLAVRSLKGLPLTYPGTTGISEPLTGGVLAKP